MWQQPQFFQQPGYYPDQFGGPPQEFPPQFVQAGDPRQPPPPYYPPHPPQYPGRAQQPEVNIYQNADQKQAKRKTHLWTKCKTIDYTEVCNNYYHIYTESNDNPATKTDWLQNHVIRKL